MVIQSQQQSLRFAIAAIRMSFRRNLQYRGQHMINNVASAIFGFIYMAIWRSVAQAGTGEPGYTALSLVQYIMVNQCLMWLTTFDRYGILLAGRVRDGTIGSDLMRPVGFMALHMGQIYGGKLYNFFFRSLALAAIFALAVGMQPPAGSIPLVVAAVIIATHIGSLMVYFVGLAGFWTVETGWLYILFQTMTILMGGPSVPLDFMPAAVAAVARALPFACLGYYPASIYMGLLGLEALLIMIAWATILTAAAVHITHRARRRAEVVGG
jgi:ABC-2 type transport system permease protein